MLNFRLNQEKLQELKKKVKLVTLAAGIAIIATGCTKKENDFQEIGYEIVSETDDTSELYSYIVNTHGFENENIVFSELDPISLYQVTEEENYNQNNKATGFFIKYMRIVWPDCFSLYDTAYRINGFDFQIQARKLSDTNGISPIVVVHSSMTAKRDLNLNVTFLDSDQKEIKKGDTLSSTAIYYNGELVAYQQTGAGSDSQNVIDATVGDVDLALSTVEDYNLLRETEIIDLSDLKELENALNEKENNKVLK